MLLPAQVDVVVIGAGLSGLAAARQIQQSGLSVVIVESSDAVGGRVRTDRVDGFLLDRGFQVLLTAYPELATQVDMEALDLQSFDPGALVWIKNKNSSRGKGHVISDPFRKPSTLLATTFAPIGTVIDKLRIVLLRLRVLRGVAPKLLRNADMSTLDALRSAGFSPRMIETFFKPLFGGVQLDPQLATSRRMFDIIFRSLSEGQSVLPAHGMQALPEQLASRLHPNTIHLNSPVESLDGTMVTLRTGERIAARAVVVATDGPSASILLNLPPVQSRTAGCVYFSADTPPNNKKYVILDGSGKGPVLNVAIISNVAPSYAPPGKHLIAAALPGVISGNLEQLARQQLREWWGPQVDTWKHLRTYAISHGGPVQSAPFSPKQRVSLGDGRFVCGDHRDTGSIQGALYSGRRCGDAVVQSLA